MSSFLSFLYEIQRTCICIVYRVFNEKIFMPDIYIYIYSFKNFDIYKLI